MNQVEDMRLFVQTVDSGSFTAAAEKLGLSKQMVSKRVAQLEARLGVRLLVRTTRTLRTTDLGVQYYEQATRAVQQVEEVERAIARQAATPRGRLRISAPMTFGTLHLGAAIPRFLAAYPEVDIEMELNDRMVDLVAEGFDVGVRIGVLPDSSLVAQRVAIMELVTCCSPAYRKRRGAPALPADLRHHDCLPYGHKRHVEWVFAAKGRETRVSVAGRLCANNGEVLRDAAIAGLGFANLPTFIVGDAIARGQLVTVLDGYRPAAAGVHVVHPAHRQASLAVRAFADFMRSTFAAPHRATRTRRDSKVV